MAREIDLTRKLSEADLRYLVDRGRWDDLRRNARHLGVDAPNLPSARGLRMQVPRSQLRNTDAFDQIAETLGVKTEEAPEEAGRQEGNQNPESGGSVDYARLTIPQLKEEMDKRRTQYEREDDSEGVELMTYSSDARKDDLVSALKLDDESDSEEEES